MAAMTDRDCRMVLQLHSEIGSTSVNARGTRKGGADGWMQHPGQDDLLGSPGYVAGAE
jgi:hypothetical protein